MTQNDVRLQIGKHWVWVVDVVFGWSLGYGFQILQESLSATNNTWVIIKQSIVALGVVAFVVYDVGAYHLLIQRFPYRLQAWSFFRYMLELFMTFCLLRTLMLGLGKEPEKQGLAILVTLTLWHAAVIAWHYAASIEVDQKLPKLKAVLWHIWFLVYWIVFGGCYWLASINTDFSTVQSDVFICLLSMLLVIFSISRTLQLIRYFPPMPTDLSTGQHKRGMGMITEPTPDKVP